MITSVTKPSSIAALKIQNLATNPDYQPVVRQLKDELAKWMKDQNDFLVFGGPVPFLKTKHPLDQNSKLNQVPDHLLNSIKNYKDPHSITKQNKAF